MVDAGRVHQSDLPGMACCQLLAPTLSSGQIMTRTEYLSAPGFTFKLELTCLSSQSLSSPPGLSDAAEN